MPRQRVNPAFAISRVESDQLWTRLQADPKPLERPVAVLAGYHSPLISISGLHRKLISLTSQRPADFEAVHFPGVSTFEAAAERAHARISSFLEREQASECDIVALSMGGLIARVLECNYFNHHRPLRIRRIFTLSTPHQGAILADLVQPDPAAADMERNSPFLRRLDHLSGFAASSAASSNGARAELHCYSLLRDWWVGATRAAPPGQPILWRDTSGAIDFAFSHFVVTSDVAILADIALRLRSEEPVASPGPPPPTD